jgi:hypothetical protein
MVNHEYDVVVYTSCSANYLPKARVLNETLKKHNTNSACVLCLCDEFTDDAILSEFDEVWTPHNLGYDSAWIFKHNVMELCTAVKGRALVKIMEEYDSKLYLYLDPDVCVYENLDIVIDYLEGHSIGLTPHINKPEDTEIGVRLTELSVLNHGTYNLGHLILRKSVQSLALAKWWADRLDDYCYDEKDSGLFTDQRWMDLVPALFDDVRIMKHSNLNLASWNFYNRDVEQLDDGRFMVDGLPLLTYHFSGTGPTGTHRRVRSIFRASDNAISRIESDYERKIENYNQKDFEHIEFKYNEFSGGQKINCSVRKLYRKSKDLQEAFQDPFDSVSGHSYYNWCKNSRPDLLANVSLHSRNVERAFYELFDKNWYLDRYPQVKQLIEKKIYKNALEHYTKIGSQMFYDPCEVFSSVFYHQECVGLDTNSIGTQSGMKGTYLWHYLTIGLENGIEPIRYFDSQFYLKENMAIKSLFEIGILSCPLVHFKRHGMKMGISPGPHFDNSAYMASSAEARELVEDGRANSGYHAYLVLQRSLEQATTAA